VRDDEVGDRRPLTSIYVLAVEFVERSGKADFDEDPPTDLCGRVIGLRA